MDTRDRDTLPALGDDEEETKTGAEPAMREEDREFTDEKPLGPFVPIEGVPAYLEQARRVDHDERNMVLSGVRQMIALQKKAAREAQAEREMSRSFQLSTTQQFLQVRLDIQRLDTEMDELKKRVDRIHGRR